MISLDQVKHIAKLARLGLTNQEAEKMQKELGVILDYIDLLDTADVSSVKTEAHLFETKNISRRDVASNPDENQIKEIINQFPSKENDFIKVKEVLKQN